MIPFQLIFTSAVIEKDLLLNSNIIESIRLGHLEQLVNIIVLHPRFFKKFNLSYWLMAKHYLESNFSFVIYRTMILILFSQLTNKNEAVGKYNPLIFATLSDDLKLLKDILRLTDVNCQNKLGETALIVAVRNGLYVIAKKLIEHGANVNISDKKGRFAIEFATKLKDPLRSRMIFLLFSNWANVSCLKWDKYKIIESNCNMKKVQDLTNFNVELNADELLRRRLLMDFEEKAEVLAVMIFVLACLLVKFSYLK